MSRKKFRPGQDVEIRGIGRLSWRPARYVGICTGLYSPQHSQHVVEDLTMGRRVVSDDRIRNRISKETAS